MPHVTYTIRLHVRNQPGVLVRVAHVFARRGCNIQSLHVDPNNGNGLSVMTITVRDVSHIEQIQKQLEKLVDVNHATVEAKQ